MKQYVGCSVQASWQKTEHGDRAMGFTSAEIIRPLVGSILQNGRWAHAFLCHRCLVTLTLEQLGRGYKDYEVRRGMAKLLESPEALVYMRAFPCAECQDTLACLSATWRESRQRRRRLRRAANNTLP